MTSGLESGDRKMLKTKRVYDKPEEKDGFRILVDRLWPRGLTKSKAKVDLWLKDAAPSHGLRKWFGHDPARWLLFKEQYAKELVKKGRVIRGIQDLEKREGIVTLLFGAKDSCRNNAAALIEFLKKKRRRY